MNNKENIYKKINRLNFNKAIQFRLLIMDFLSPNNRHGMNFLKKRRVNNKLEKKMNILFNELIKNFSLHCTALLNRDGFNPKLKKNPFLYKIIIKCAKMQLVETSYDFRETSIIFKFILKNNFIGEMNEICTKIRIRPNSFFKDVIIDKNLLKDQKIIQNIVNENPESLILEKYMFNDNMNGLNNFMFTQKELQRCICPNINIDKNIELFERLNMGLEEILNLDVKNYEKLKILCQNFNMEFAHLENFDSTYLICEIPNEITNFFF